MGQWYVEYNRKMTPAERTRKWVKDNPETVKLARRAYRLKARYNLTPHEWDQMYAEQQYSCKICKEPEPNKTKMSTDHCHKTGKIRGILCSKCNRGLGLFNDDITKLKTAIEYLK